MPIVWILARKPFRGKQSVFLAGIGLFAGFTYASLSSIQRLAGLESNFSEVQRFGALSVDQLRVKEDHINTPNVSLVDDSAHD